MSLKPLALFSGSLLLSVLLSGCFGGAVAPQGEVGSVGACNPLPCIKIEFDAPPELPQSVPAPVRDRITRDVSAVLYEPLDEEATEVSPGALKQQLAARLTEATAAGVSDAPVDWALSRRAALLFTTGEIATVAITDSGYLGGAHGFNDRTLLCFDLRDGKRLTLTELVSDSSRGILQRIAEAEFRRVKGIAAERPLQEEGLFLGEGEPFKVSENFGVVEGGLLLHYNPYDIGPFSMGETDLLLPREVVVPLLKGGETAAVALFGSLDPQG